MRENGPCPFRISVTMCVNLEVKMPEREGVGDEDSSSLARPMLPPISSSIVTVIFSLLLGFTPVKKLIKTKMPKAPFFSLGFYSI